MTAAFSEKHRCMSEQNQDLAEQLAQLQQQYLQRLQQELPALQQQIDVLDTLVAWREPVSDLIRRFHSLAGSAGTFGFPNLGVQAKSSGTTM